MLEMLEAREIRRPVIDLEPWLMASPIPLVSEHSDPASDAYIFDDFCSVIFRVNFNPSYLSKNSGFELLIIR